VSCLLDKPNLEQGFTSRSFRAIGTNATVVVREPEIVDRAASILREEIHAIERVASRFRADSELERRVHGNSGVATRVSPLLFHVIDTAQRVAERTHGAVDPTVCNALEVLGYDRDFSEISEVDARPSATSIAIAGYSRVQLDSRTRSVTIPKGVRLDFGATAKALIVDRAADRINQMLGVGVLVSLGGDLAVAGEPPADGWPVAIAVDSSIAPDEADHVVAVRQGGLASSSTLIRSWSMGAEAVHHIVDPATGKSADPHWALVSCVGPTCVDANALSTAAIVWGRSAPDRLASFGQPARLVSPDGQVATVGGWPT